MKTDFSNKLELKGKSTHITLEDQDYFGFRLQNT